MLHHHRRPRIIPDHPTDSRKRRNALLLKVLLLCEPFACFFASAGVIAFCAYYLVECTTYSRVIYAMILVLGTSLAAVLIFARFSGRRTDGEVSYIEHLVYHFCKTGSFKQSLRLLSGIFSDGEVKRAIGGALLAISQGAGTQEAMQLVERRLGGRNVKLVHRYIYEAESKERKTPPAEILTGLLHFGESHLRSISEVRFDRVKMAFVSAVSFGICYALRCFAEDYGFASDSFPADLLMAIVLGLFLVIYFLLELREATGGIIKRHNKTFEMAACGWLRELSYFLIIMPVPDAIAVSVAYSEKRIRHRVSKLAASVAKEDATSDCYLRFAGGKDKRLTRIMEFLYAKSSSNFIAPYELAPIIRLLDEMEAEDAAAIGLEDRRSRMNLLLAPQAAALVMVAGNFLTLLTTAIGRDI